MLGGADLSGSLGVLPFAMHSPVILFNSFGYVIGDDVLRNFLTVGHHYNALHFDTTTGRSYNDELLTEGREIDATNTDLRPFAARGGKLLLVHGGADNIIPTASTVDFYTRLQGTMGADNVAAFARLYIVPGFGHGDGRFDAGLDAVGVLDDWVEHGAAPKDVLLWDNNGGRTRPLCEWPTYPRYNGSGDWNVAANFTCTAPEKNTPVNGRGQP